MTFVVGLFDEHEFMTQRPPHYGFVAYGPFDGVEEAVAFGQGLSTDPDEAVVLELVGPCGHDGWQKGCRWCETQQRVAERAMERATA